MKTRIKELRKERKLSQEELAAAVGTTRQTITSIEVGKYTASLPLAYRIARYFGLRIEDVFDFSEFDVENLPGKVDYSEHCYGGRHRGAAGGAISAHPPQL